MNMDIRKTGCRVVGDRVWKSKVIALTTPYTLPPTPYLMGLGQ